MATRKHIKDAPDWPAVRRTLSEEVGKTEAEIDELAETWDSLDLVELVMAL
ncbi:MAG TPA: hypothetical protein VJO16_18645 [Candidatus Acidoferrum sp.]|nr:hypothetical protein [Candidatus Acidoferrum sp.]